MWSVGWSGVVSNDVGVLLRWSWVLLVGFGCLRVVWGGCGSQLLQTSEQTEAMFERVQ